MDDNLNSLEIVALPDGHAISIFFLRKACSEVIPDHKNSPKGYLS